MRNLIKVIISILMLSLICSCNEKRFLESEIPSAYKDLKEKDDVLFNLELAYNERNIVEYIKLLDPDFIFIFSDADYAEGKTPKQWDREAEVRSVKNMFDPYYQGPVNPITRINLLLTYSAGDLTWTATNADSLHPGETWYEKVVNYDLILTTTSTTINALDMQALFIIRRSIAENDTIWQIIRWYDISKP